MTFDRIEEAARADARGAEHYARAAQAAQTIIIPALIAAVAWFREDINKIGTWLFVLLIIILVVAQLALFILTFATKQSLQGLYFEAKDLKSKVDTCEDQVDIALKTAQLFSFIERFSASSSSALLTYVGQPLASNEDLQRVVRNILDPLVTNGEEIFGFESTEKWNFVVYIYDPTKDALVPVCREKAQTHPSQTLGREWRRGQGHVGFSFANSRAVITEDSRTPDVNNLVSAAEGHKQNYDETTYISFASIPIGPVADQQEPLGVLVATSDRSGRFSSDNSRILVHASLALANILTVMAPSTVQSLSTILQGGNPNGQ